ncbi:unnamed protein product [Phytophthora fragariaefolia]|uniref:Unnamed protein product n=1 Tax=Phytophthora fragariaefolia TaxID=1490495 RepID=A0A9W6TNH2_9STRA|nr:unnamed protein product [Phytophthora fragariaefolia]
MGYKIRWDDRIWDRIEHNHKSEPNLPWTSQAPSSSPEIGNYIGPPKCTEFTAWPGDSSLLKTQGPAIESGTHKKGRYAKTRDTLQGNPGPDPDPDPEYWIHDPQIQAGKSLDLGIIPRVV